jgi:hypothetical protein
VPDLTASGAAHNAQQRGRRDTGQWTVKALLAVLLTVMFGLIIARGSADPDLWGHIRVGQEISRQLGIPLSDPYSFTSDRVWVNHEWLAEVFLAAAYDGAGTPGLVVLVGGVALAGFCLIWRRLKAMRVRLPTRAGLLVLACLGTGYQFMAPRPQVFSLLMFSALAAVLVRSENGNHRSLIALPALFMLWANLHGAWIVGLGFLWAWAATAAIRRCLPTPWLLFAVGAGTLATLANPYAVGLWSFILETVRLGRADIQDWQPLILLPERLAFWTATTCVLLWAWRKRGSPKDLRLVPVAILGVLSLKVVRLDVYYVVSAVFLLGRLLSDCGPCSFPLSRKSGWLATALVAVTAAAGLALVAYRAGQTATCLSLDPATSPEQEAAQFVDANGLRGRMLTWFDYGEYAIWHFWPNILVSYDGRRETVYSESVQRAHLRFYSGGDVSYPQRLDADYVWLPESLPVVRALRSDGWQPIFQGSRSVILAREPGNYVQPQFLSRKRCFPGP